MVIIVSKLYAYFLKNLQSRLADILYQIIKSTKQGLFQNKVSLKIHVRQWYPKPVNDADIDGEARACCTWSNISHRLQHSM